jgi:SPP1 family predicted phage head-tail adaptor
MNPARHAAGRSRHRLVLQARAPAGDGGGGQAGDPWAAPVTVATVWGDIVPLNGTERLRAMKLESQVTHRIAIRFRLGVTGGMRIVFGARTFNIRAVVDVGERHRMLELLCEEGVAT